MVSHRLPVPLRVSRPPVKQVLLWLCCFFVFLHVCRSPAYCGVIKVSRHVGVAVGNIQGCFSMTIIVIFSVEFDYFKHLIN